MDKEKAIRRLKEMIESGDLSQDTIKMIVEVEEELSKNDGGEAQQILAELMEDADENYDTFKEISDWIASAETTYMVKGVDYVTVGQKSGTTLGQKATAEGYETTASGDISHAEGGSTTASANVSHAEGSSTTASGYASHAEGNSTIASGNVSHAEGSGTTASGNLSHAEGYSTTASGADSHAEGNGTTASGAYSHAEGNGTIAAGLGQHAGGEYNIADTPSSTQVRGTYAEIIGNGTGASERSNARTLDWSGNEWLAGTLKLGGTSASDNSSVDVLSAINTLRGSASTPGSVAYQIAQVVAGADTSLDTLKEIADWILAHPNDASNYATKTELTTHTGDTTVHVTSSEKSTWNGITTHTGDTTIHVTSSEKATWNGKQDALSYDTVPTANSDNIIKSGDLHTYMSSNYATKTELTTHTGDTTIHVTSSEKTTWNGKQDALSYDTVPTANSDNIIKSGDLYTYMSSILSRLDDAEAEIRSLNGTG